MIGLKRRIELVERTRGPKGRLIVVRANSPMESNEAMAAHGIERRPDDTVVKLHRAVVELLGVIGVHDEGPEAFLASIDGKSLPLVREAA